jgi:hypothetical protein
VLADLEGKGQRIRTVAIPIWVKHGINAWMIAAGIDKGRLLRSVSKSGKVNRDPLSDWAVWSVVEQEFGRGFDVSNLRHMGFFLKLFQFATRCVLN